MILICLANALSAQRFTVDSSNVRFYSEAPVENIEATTSEASSIIDLENGNMVFSIPINTFQFEKSLMQEHFNENYMESGKYPKSTFAAQAVDWEYFEGTKDITVTGKLNIHGVTRDAEMKGTMTIDKSKVVIDAVFNVALVSHKIQIPKALFYNIAEIIEVTVHFEYKPLKK